MIAGLACGYKQKRFLGVDRIYRVLLEVRLVDFFIMVSCAPRSRDPEDQLEKGLASKDREMEGTGKGTGL
jgi:hypothetical protein